MSSKKSGARKIVVFKFRDEDGGPFGIVLAREGGGRAAIGFGLEESNLGPSIVPPCTLDRADGIWVGHGTEWRLATRDELMALGHGKDPFKKSGKKNVKK